mgnify:CR=1 FL=1
MPRPTLPAVRVIPPGVSCLGKDYVLQLRVKNAPMLRAMRAAGFTTGASLARAVGVSQNHVSYYLTLKRAPLDGVGDYRTAIVKIAAALRCPVEALFPEQHLDRPLKVGKWTIEADIEDIEQLTDRLADQAPSAVDRIASAEATKLIAGAMLDRLTARERDVVEARFGLAGRPEETLDDIAARFGVHKERVRQIEAKALRRLRHPVATRVLREAAEAAGVVVDDAPGATSVAEEDRQDVAGPVPEVPAPEVPVEPPLEPVPFDVAAHWAAFFALPGASGRW